MNMKPAPTTVPLVSIAANAYLLDAISRMLMSLLCKKKDAAAMV